MCRRPLRKGSLTVLRLVKTVAYLNGEPDVIDLTYAKIIADSIGVDAPRLVTFELQYPRIIHAEFMTHRVFSRNASSSRAIPVSRMIENVLANTAMPAEWRMNEPGMQGFQTAPDDIAEVARQVMVMAAQSAVNFAKQLDCMGLHKQHVNRLTEPFQYIKVVVTSSQWKNFFGLRDHAAADPTIQKLARLMHEAYNASTPTKLSDLEHHLPYITEEDFDRAELHRTQTGSQFTTLDFLLRMSAARCARVSYNNFKGEVPRSLPTSPCSTSSWSVNRFTRARLSIKRARTSTSGRTRVGGIRPSTATSSAGSSSGRPSRTRTWKKWLRPKEIVCDGTF
jgi:hypothetical protein